MEYILVGYLIFLFAYSIYSAIAIYHLRRFGYVGDLTRPAVVLYLILSVIVIALTFVLFFANIP